MNKVLSKLPLPGRKPRASERLAGNNNWKEQPDFTTALSDSEDDGGAVLTSANLRAHKGRPVTNEGQRLKRGLENAKEWVDQSPAPKKGPGKALDDDSSEDSSPYAASSRLDPASSRLGAQTDEDAGRRGGIRPFHAPAAQDDDGDSGEDDQPLGQKMFDELTRLRSSELSTANGQRKKSARRRGESAGRKVTYNLTDDSESMDDMDLAPQRSGLLHGIHSGPSYHDPFEREISGTLQVYNSQTRVTKSRGTSRGSHGFDGQDSRRSMQSTMDSPQARARALAEADDLIDMYAQPKGTVAREASYGGAELGARFPSSGNAPARPKSVLKTSAALQPLQYADGLGGTTGGFKANLGAAQRYDISDSSDSEVEHSSRNGLDQYGRRVRSRNGYEDGSSRPGTQGRMQTEMQSPEASHRGASARSWARTGTSERSRGAFDFSGRAEATDTLARTLRTVNKAPRNPEYLPDLDDSDSDVLRQTDSDAEGNDQQDTMRRLELAHAKTAPFTLSGTNDFDSFMKSVDKSVNRAVKVERRSQKSRSGSRPESRAASRGGETRSASRLPSRSGSRAEMRRQQAEGPNVVSTSTSDMPAQRKDTGGHRGYVAPQDSPEASARRPTVVKELGASVGLRRQHLAQIENGRVVPNSPTPNATRSGTAKSHNFSPGNTFSPDTPMRRPMTTNEDIVLAEQQEEMELLQRQQQIAIQKEREQQEILNRLKRDKTRRESKVKDTQQELEQLWEDQMQKDDLQYQQQKEIERLRHTLAAREQRERAQQEELERLRRDVSERARADAEGAMAFDKLLAEKHKKLLLTPAEIRQQVEEQMQREALQREHEAELRQMQEEKARQVQEAAFQKRQEEIAREGSRHGVSDISNADVLRHRKPAYDENGNLAPGSRNQSRNLGSPSQLSRPATQLSMRPDGSRPGTAGTNFTVDSTSTSIREVKEASEAAAQVRKGIKQAAKSRLQQEQGNSNDRSAGLEQQPEVAPTQKVKVSASKETPNIAKERHQAVKKLNLDQIKSKHDKAPALKQFEMQQQVRDHETELQRASEDVRNKADLAEAKRILEGSKSRAGQRAPSSAYGTQGTSRTASSDPALNEELRRLEEEKAEFERRELVQEEYIQQLKYEQEQKLEREAAKRKALQDLRGENNLIDRMLRETDSLESGIIQEVGTLEALKEQFRRKQKLAEQLKEQQRELAEKQKQREEHLKSLKSEVSKASDAAGIQLMQMNRLKAIQEEAIYMQEQQHKELEFLKAELQRKADLTGEQEEIERLRQEAKRLEMEQAEQRAKLAKEKESLEAAMKTQQDVEKEMLRLQTEKEKREEAEKNLRQTLAMEAREMEKLSTEAAKRKAEIEALQAEKEIKQKEIEGTEKEKLQHELEELQQRKQELAQNEERIAREKAELQELNRRREEELKELEALRKRSEEIERAQAKAKRAEEEALRAKEEKERARLRAEEDRIRAALEFEAKKAQQEMEKERKKRQNEIDRLKKEIEKKKIAETPLIEEEEEEEEPSTDKKVSDWLQSNHPEDVQEGEKRAKRDKKKKKSTAGNITARSENDEDDDGGGNMTDRSDTSGKGPPTQWRLARHGKIKELEAMLTPENVDDRDGKGNTCLHHACMQGKKRVAKMVLRLGADINAQNKRGHTCLHYCFAYNYEELGEYLISKGADETILNELGATCREVESGSVTQRSER